MSNFLDIFKVRAVKHFWHFVHNVATDLSRKVPGTKVLQMFEKSGCLIKKYSLTLQDFNSD